MNKVFVNLYVPLIEQNFELFIPINRKICAIIKMVTKSIDELSDGNYKVNTHTSLYNRKTGEVYDENITVKESDIRNGTSLIII